MRTPPLSVAFMALMLAASWSAAQGRPSPPSRRMLDGKTWTTANLNVRTPESYCYDDAPENCRRYGRLYTWTAAREACRSLSGGWRLPTAEEWRQLGNRHGGIRQESADLGKAAYFALIAGGRSGFNAVLGGGRSDQGGEYLRADAHGFYWSASESSAAHAWFYNFGKNGQSFGRHENGEKLRALSVRCVKD